MGNENFHLPVHTQDPRAPINPTIDDFRSHYPAPYFFIGQQNNASPGFVWPSRCYYALPVNALMSNNYTSDNSSPLSLITTRQSRIKDLEVIITGRLVSIQLPFTEPHVRVLISLQWCLATSACWKSWSRARRVSVMERSPGDWRTTMT